MAEWTTLIFYSFLSPLSPRLRHPESHKKGVQKNKITVTKIPPFWFRAKRYLFNGHIWIYVHPSKEIILF
ncbi:MAG: hypothetical protein RLY15_219 [Bacteroidota bacterium]|jgi:hypothetical protein